MRASGFPVVAAGRGHKWQAHFAQSTPETVWGYYGLTPEQAKIGGLNPKMFNSFLDGSKPAIETTAVCNATGLVPQTNGLAFPPASRFELAQVCKPKSDGGTLEKKGVTEVVSSLDRDGKDVPHNLVMGTYVVIESESPYASQCFAEYHLLPDQSGRYAALYRPTHMIGLELGISVASAALRKEPTGGDDLDQRDRLLHVASEARTPAESSFAMWATIEERTAWAAARIALRTALGGDSP